MTLDLSPDISKPKHLGLGLLFILVHILSFYFAESENFTATKQLDHFNATGNSKSFYVHASNFTNKPMSNKTMTANDTQEYLTEQRSDVPVTKGYSTKQLSDRAKDYLINQRLSNGSGSTNTEMIRDNITSKIDGITQANVVATVQNKVGESSQNERNETVNGITTGKMMAEGSGARIEMSSSVIRLTNGKKVETRDGMTSASSTTATTTLIKPESESDVIIKYNCMRSGMSCQNNGMCATDGGYCSCPNGVHGYDCSVGKESIIDKCNPPCQNGGTCYTGQNLFKSNTLSTRCFCTEAYYGNTCQHNRVHHKCSHNSMEIVIAPIVNTADQFKGSVYVKGHEDDPNCVFIPERNGYSVLRRVLQFTDCGNAINETDNGKTVMTFQIVVRYDEILLDTDEELSFMCHVTPVEGSSYVWQTWMIAQDDVRSHSRHRKIFTGTRQPIDMEIQTADGRPLTDPQQLGTILTLKFTLDERSGYESFRVEQISVSNGVSGSKRHSIQLVADNCPTPDALEVKKVIVSFMKTTPNIVMLQFRVFKLRYSNQLFFESLLKICAVGNDCSNKECPRTNRTVRFRMKRHEDSNFGETIYESTNVSLTVLYPDSNGSNTSSNNVEQDNSNASSVWNERCSRTTVFIIFIVSAVAIIVALTTILLTTCFRISYKRI